jgi:hypothetical protein
LIDRRTFLSGAGAVLLAAPIPSSLDAFRGGLRAFGYVEGNNLVMTQRYAIEPERLAGLAAELVGAHVDALVTTGNPVTRAAKHTAGSTSTSSPRRLSGWRSRRPCWDERMR